MTRTLALLLPIAACWRQEAKPVAPAAPPPKVDEPQVPPDCSPNGVMGAPEVDTPIRALDPALPLETIELLTCRSPPPPYTAKLDDEGNPDETDAYWHSFSSWKAYLVRRGAHPFVWETGLSVGQYHEGSADAHVIGVVPGRVPLVVIDHEEGAMGMHSQQIVVFRVDSPPQRVLAYQGDALAAELTPTGFVLRRCYQTSDQREHGVDCLTFPDQIETTTLSWTGKALVTVSTTPYQTAPPP